MNSTYQQALEKVRLATQKFRKFQADYRARRIDDVTFLTARKEYDQAEKEFDLAYEKAHDDN